MLSFHDKMQQCNAYLFDIFRYLYKYAFTFNEYRKLFRQIKILYSIYCVQRSSSRVTWSSNVFNHCNVERNSDAMLSSQALSLLWCIYVYDKHFTASSVIDFFTIDYMYDIKVQSRHPQTLHGFCQQSKFRRVAVRMWARKVFVS